MKYFTLILLLLMLSTQASKALEVTDQAPDISITEWSNKPTSLVQDKNGKTVYLVEFWASWCKPCIPSVKFLNELQKKYKKQGLEIIAITDESKDDTAKFLKEHDIHYSVGFDKDGKTMQNYLTNKDGLPTSFIINKDGIVVYKGHPMKSETILEQVLNDKYDLTEVKKLKDLEKKLEEALKDFNISEASDIAEQILYISPNNFDAMQFRLLAFEKMGQEMAAFAFLDSLIKKFPDNEDTYFIKLSLLIDLKPEKVNEFAEKIYTQFKDNPKTMNRLAWELIDNGKFATQDLDIALKASQRAVKNGKAAGNDFLSASIDTLARCYYYIGLLEEAIENQEKAYNLAKGGKHEAGIYKTLQYYKKAEELKKKYQ